MVNTEKFTLPLRLIQAVIAVIELGLTAYSNNPIPKSILVPSNSSSCQSLVSLVSLTSQLSSFLQHLDPPGTHLPHRGAYQISASVSPLCNSWRRICYHDILVCGLHRVCGVVE